MPGSPARGLRGCEIHEVLAAVCAGSDIDEPRGIAKGIIKGVAVRGAVVVDLLGPGDRVAGTDL